MHNRVYIVGWPQTCCAVENYLEPLILMLFSLKSWNYSNLCAFTSSLGNAGELGMEPRASYMPDQLSS